MRQDLADERGPGQEAGPSGGRLQGRDGPPIDRDGDGLTVLDAIKKGSRVVAKISRGDIGHATTVAHMRRLMSETDAALHIVVRYAPQ